MDFTKIHGLGNDYLYINCIEEIDKINSSEFPRLARYLCNRHFGIGADGLIIIEKSNFADFKMIIYNADGTEAEMCGNGIRGVGKFLYDKNITNKRNLKIETLAGIKDINLIIKDNKVASVKVNMGKVTYNKNITICDTDEIPMKLRFVINEHEYEGTCASIGNPHFIIFVDNVEEIDVANLGEFIENSDIFLNRANVEFIQIVDRKTIKMRVWERGVGETFACGTGACCAVKVSNLYKYVDKPVKVLLKGGELLVNIDEETDEVYMEGIITKVCDGKFDWI